MLDKIVFLILSAVTLGSGIVVVTQRNLFRAALYLVMALVGVAGTFMLLEASFLAVVQVFVYAGAIMILIIFAVMLTRRVMDPDTPQVNSQWVASLLVVGVLFLLLVLTMWPTEISLPFNDITLGGINWPTREVEMAKDPVGELGRALVSSEGYVVPFEAASVLLLVAMIGAVYIVFPKKEEPQAETDVPVADSTLSVHGASGAEE